MAIEKRGEEFSYNAYLKNSRERQERVPKVTVNVRDKLYEEAVKERRRRERREEEERRVVLSREELVRRKDLEMNKYFRK